MIELHMRPDLAPMPGKAFREMAGPFSIAIDGFVPEPPWFDDALPSQNFNHHEGSPRLETRSTSGQILVAIRQGFFDRFRDRNGPQAHVWANDCDEDVSLSWYLLKNHALAHSVVNPTLNRIAHIVDMMDTTAGAYPFPGDLPSLRMHVWAFEPYRRFRLSGGLASRDTNAFRSIVTDVENRISLCVMGQGREIEVDTRYEVLSNEKGWVHVHEVGDQARVGMFSAGVRAFLASSSRPDGRWHHVVGRMSTYIRFPVPAILRAMDEAEGLVGNPDHWGGGDTIGGSPRNAGSGLGPKQAAEVVRQVMDIERVVESTRSP